MCIRDRAQAADILKAQLGGQDDIPAQPLGRLGMRHDMVAELVDVQKMCIRDR